MCGIFFHLQSGDQERTPHSQVQSSFDSIQHRGPDVSQLHIREVKTEEGDVATLHYGFHRLAIHDLTEAGMQPFIMYTNTKCVTLLCNGEIFTFRELIQQYDLKCTSDSDCEVLIRLYLLFDDVEQFRELIATLDAEFAFVLVDRDLRDNHLTILAARDHFGKRSLYAGWTEHKLLLASEKHALISLSKEKGATIVHFPPRQLWTWQWPRGVTSTSPVLSSPVMAAPLPSSPPSPPSTSPPLRTLMGLVPYSKHILWDFPVEQKVSRMEYSELLSELRRRLTEAVILRLDSDRPLGAFLSGGLDSSYVCAEASRILGSKSPPRQLRTFSIGMPGSDDLRYARQVADHIGSDHTEVVVDQEECLAFLEKVPGMIGSYDTTTCRASCLQLMLCQYIKEKTNVRVLLTGDGFDELFGSYLYFRNAPSNQEFRQEIQRLLTHIDYFDVLRAEMSCARFGLECRVVALALPVVSLGISLPEELYHHRHGNEEKFLMRDMLKDTGLLPESIRTRRKEAFSDGVSPNHQESWYQIIQRYIIHMHVQEQRQQQQCTPPDGVMDIMSRPDSHAMNVLDMEKMWYKSLYDKTYGQDMDGLIPFYWQVQWCGALLEPSARALPLYTDTD